MAPGSGGDLRRAGRRYARSQDQTELQRMLSYCRKRKGGTCGSTVVYMLDRFAPDQYDHHALKAYLMKLGITLRSVAPTDRRLGDRPVDGRDPRGLQRVRQQPAPGPNPHRHEGRGEGRWTFPTPLGYRKDVQGQRDEDHRA
ncbi:MAG: recombinase family protein [Thermoanaerobaculia bacterium]